MENGNYVIITTSRYSTLKAKPNNLFVVSLSLSGLLMMSKVPIFLWNLYHGGPHAGVLGAQVTSLSTTPETNSAAKFLRAHKH